MCTAGYVAWFWLGSANKIWCGVLSSKQIDNKHVIVCVVIWAVITKIQITHNQCPKIIPTAMLKKIKPKILKLISDQDLRLKEPRLIKIS